MSQPFVEPCDQGIIGAAPCPRELGREIPKTTRSWVLAACVLSSSMAFIDGSALTVALPALRADLNADLATVQWVLNGYVLALAALTLIGGGLADVYGKARMLALGSAGFGLASIMCAVAATTEWLIFARIAQGIAAAVLTPASLALIGAVFPKEERNSAIGIWAAASALTTSGGPVLGGWLTETFGWQAVFWINPPIALATVVILAVSAPRDHVEERRFDVVGAVILAVSLSALAWMLSVIGPGETSELRYADKMSWMETIAALTIGVTGLVTFAIWERMTKHPMTPPRMFANRTFNGLNASTLMIYSALSTMFFLLPFELVDRRGISPSEAGLAFLPFTLGVGLLSRVFGGLADKVGARAMLIVGPVGAAVAYLLFVAGRDASVWLGVIIPMAVLGIAFSVIVAPLTATVMSSVPERDEGLASGMNNTASRIAQLLAWRWLRDSRRLKWVICWG